VLADTCAWIDYLKPGPSALKSLMEKLLLNDRVVVVGPVLYELTQGIKSAKERSTVMEALKSLDYIEMTEALWIKAGELSSTLRKAGKTIPFSDVLIATLALENNLSVITIDKHFVDVKGLDVLPS
jgi:predicted nucleic acid-binding protein